MSNRNYYNDEDDLNDTNIMINTNTSANRNINNSNNMNTNNRNNKNENHEQSQNDQNNFAMNFVTNPQEAIAKELLNQAEQKSKGWLDRLKCNIE
jgi:hypothetical protein